MSKRGWWSNFDIRWGYEPIIVVKPNLKSGDPFAEVASILDSPWNEPPFNAGTIVLDTITSLANVFLDMSASEGRYTNKPIQFGRGKHVVTIPAEGDYRVGQRLSQELADMALDIPMDVLFLGHVGVEAKGKKGDSGYSILRAGMGTVGGAQVASYGGQFDQYVFLKHKRKQDKTSVVTQLVGDGIYSAKVREDGTSPPPQVVDLPNDLEGQREWYRARAKEAGIDFDDPLTTGYFRMGIYSEIGVGKTRLALSAPRGPIVYIAVDKGSEYLRSMFSQLKTKNEAWPLDKE